MTLIQPALGRIEVESDALPYTFSIRNRPAHLYVVAVHNAVASLFVAKKKMHIGVVKEFRLRDETVQGGGVVFTDEKCRLILAGGSGTYGYIPDALAEEFGLLLRGYLAQEGIEISDVYAKGVDMQSGFWKDHEIVRTGAGSS